MTLNALVAGLRHRWFVVVAFVVLGGLSAGAYGIVATPVYQGKTSLFVSLQTTITNTPAELVAGNNYAAQKVSSYVAVATSRRVLDRVATELGGDPAAILEDVTASSLPDSVIITITGDSTNPDDAALLANTTAKVFADVVVNEIESPAGGGPGPVKVEILSTAVPPLDPVTPNIPLALALGIFGGLVFGGAVAIVLTLLDRRVHNKADVVATLDRPTLGVITASGASGPTTRLATADLRTLAVTITALAHREPFATMAIAAPTDEAVAAETAAGLAQALAETGLDIAVIDTVFDGGGISSFFGVDDRTGLRDVLAGKVSLRDTLVQTSVSGLSVLPLGRNTSVTSSALSGDGFASIVKELGELTDFVVVDAGAVLGSGDALAARVSADQAIVALEAGSVGKKELSDAAQQLEVVGTPLLGIVISKRSRRMKDVPMRFAAPARGIATTASKRNEQVREVSEPNDGTVLSS